jgi:hypothetical protein
MDSRFCGNLPEQKQYQPQQGKRPSSELKKGQNCSDVVDVDA